MKIKYVGIARICLLALLVLSLVFTGCATKAPQTPEGTQPPVSPLMPAPTEKAALYFAGDQAMYLEPEFREVKTGGNLPQTIVEELVKGPAEQGHFPTLPKTTRVLSLEVQQGIAYVNLSGDFERDYPGGTTGEAMALGSVIRSLTELENINAVQFLIEGKKVDVLAKGHVELNRPLERRITLGAVEQVGEMLESDQKKVSEGGLKWRLDPLETARKEGPRWGLFAKGDYTLVSKVEQGAYSGTGEALVRHRYKGYSFDIKLIQPVKTGTGGIWAINGIYPYGTEASKT